MLSLNTSPMVAICRHRLATLSTLLWLSACGGGASSLDTAAVAAPASAQFDSSQRARALSQSSTAAGVPATLTVQNTVIGSTPAVLAYNTAHAMTGSNALDWMRYSGVKAVRVFVSPSDIEPTDDIAGTGDGVTDQSSFNARRALLRANAANPAQALDPQYVNWAKFETGYNTMASGNNRFVVNQFFPQLRGLGIDILVNLTASPSRFPVAGSTDYANIWELWQHYYAQAYKLGRDYDVRRYGMFNEPNGFSPKPTVESWELRLRICSDAIQAALADVNARHGKSLVPEVFAPNTASGKTKYNDVGNTWGQQAVLNRHKSPWNVDLGTSWSNFQVYNYQKYTMFTNDTDIGGGVIKSGYINDFDELKAKIVADMGGEAVFPMALTEMNARTSSEYDTLTANADTPSDYAAVAANSIALSQDRAQQLYLFKFGMTAASASSSSPTVYAVAKNGTHYVSNFTSTGQVNPYGGASGTAEVWRLFNKAAGQSRQRLGHASSLGAEVWTQISRDPGKNVVYAFVANKGLTAVNLDIDLSALGLTDGSLVTVEDVNTAARGAVSGQTTLAAGRAATGSMPAESVRLVTVYGNATAPATLLAASADTSLRDGTGKNTSSGGTATVLQLRADGSPDTRRVVLMKFAVPTDWSGTERVLLALNAATTAGTDVTQAHVYGLTDSSWTEATPWAGLTSALKQSVGSGKVIANNVVANAGSTTQVLGQLMVNVATPSEKLLDVTDFVKAQSGGQVSFLIVQDHRWDKSLTEISENPTGSQTSTTSIVWSGDVQAAGIAITARESASPPLLKVFAKVTVRDVSASFGSTSSGLVLNRATQTYNGSITVTNTSANTLAGPFQLQFNGLPAGVTLANASGLRNGVPYLSTAAASLAPGQSATVSLSFKNPAKVGITYNVGIFAGTF